MENFIVSASWWSKELIRRLAESSGADDKEVVEGLIGEVIAVARRDERAGCEDMVLKRRSAWDKKWNEAIDDAVAVIRARML